MLKLKVEGPIFCHSRGEIFAIAAGHGLPLVHVGSMFLSTTMWALSNATNFCFYSSVLTSSFLCSRNWKQEMIQFGWASFPS
jgi:hypothetical protein